MSFDLALEPGEEVITNLIFVPAKNKEAVQIAITDRAVILLRKKLFAVKDPFYAERIPLRNVVEVRIKKIPPYWMWAVAALMIAGGGLATILMFEPLLHSAAVKLSGYPPAVMIVGCIVPFLARNRYGLQIRMVDRDYKWDAPLLVDRASRDEVSRFLTAIAEAAQKAGLQTLDDRPPRRPASIGRFTPFYPEAEKWDEHPTGKKRDCYHCHKPLAIPRWDDLNGFLLRCPYCDLLHGKYWAASKVIFSGLILSALSFFFIMRWKVALPLFSFFALFFAGLFFADISNLPDWLQLAVGLLAMLGPVVINSVVLVRHNLDLNSSIAFQIQAEKP